jgi:NifB/MoaA-like Fe-S oxidoreductase
MVPVGVAEAKVQSPAIAGGSDFGTLLTGEMFAPILREQIDKYNSMNGTQLTVVAVPNTYFGGDVSVAGLLTGKDFLAVRDKIVGDFVTIPKITIKSDEPIFLDGMSFADLEQQFPVPIFPVDTEGLIDLLQQRMAGM